MEDVAPRRTSSPSQGEARRPTKRGQLMLTHQDTSKGPSQARHVGPPGEVPGSIQARSAMLTHLDSSKTPSQARHVGPPGEVPSNSPAKGVNAGEARRPTKRGPHLAEAQSCQISPTERPSARRGTSAHQARALMNPKIGREGWEKKTDRAVGQSKPTCHGRIQQSTC